ncbi:restriction endonuclease subunit S [Streptococcus suis]|nr:restriction endonuclease subunit S [Streptococcus suis]MBY5038557.1 restriction endonuclease subunit S [Streptococcus suis]
MTPEQLKASILQRAMEGKLVPQDPTDEPASELLKRIKVEKEKLIADGKIKRDKKETELFRGADGKPYEKLADGTVKKVEVPYEIPDSWEWGRLRNLGIITSGGTPKSSEPSYYGGDIIWITPADLGKQQKNKLFTTSSKTITELGLQKSSAQLISKHSIVYSSRAPIGHINIVNDNFTTNQGCKSVTPLLANLDFLYWLLQFRTKDIILRSSGTTFKEISASGFGETLLPLPPLAEQKRIVTQIERALEKVEAYAESYNKLQELDRAFPDKLKKSILQYAMQGKLVPQDPNDEPVEVLLEKIRAEKQKLYEEGKLKKKDLAEMVVEKGDDNSPYGKIPKSWRITPLSSITNIYTGNSINATEKKTYFSGVTGINYIATKDVNFDGSIDYDNGIKIPEDYLSKFKISPANSVLLCLEGGSAGRKIGLLEQEVCFGNKLCSLSFYTGENKFLYYFLQSPQFLSDFQDSKSGIIGGVSVKNLGVITIPMPPQKEQERIRSEVEQLFQKVNQL